MLKTTKRNQHASCPSWRSMTLFPRECNGRLEEEEKKVDSLKHSS